MLGSKIRGANWGELKAGAIRVEGCRQEYIFCDRHVTSKNEQERARTSKNEQERARRFLSQIWDYASDSIDISVVIIGTQNYIMGFNFKKTRFLRVALPFS